MDPEDRQAFAESVPVYAEAAEDGTFRVVDVSTGTVVSSEHASVRAALAAALEREDISGFMKSANLRTDGEPDGVWRWLDATAEEDEPIDGARIGERAIWEMAESLNTRASSIPINGGGAPDGLKTSEPHGDAYTGGDHLANGFAHVGIVAYAADGRPHLYLYSELLPEIAAEVDRGRLAYGSVRFAFDAVDEDDNSAALGAMLISHALTNDPAVTTLTAGSERFRVPGRTKTMRARRSRWTKEEPMSDMDRIRELHAALIDNDATLRARYKAGVLLREAVTPIVRGAIAELLGEAAGLFGLSAEEVREDPYKLSEAVWALVDALKVEEVLEASGAEGGPPAPVEAQRPTLTETQRESLKGSAKRGMILGPLAARAVDGLEGEALEEWAQGVLDNLRMIFGKPEAPIDEVLAELQAREEELMAMVSDEEESEDMPPEDVEAQADTIAASLVLRMQHQRDAARRDRRELRAKVALYETREWLDAELGKRQKTLAKGKHEQYVQIAIKSGREVVEAFLDDLNMPPAVNPLDSVQTPRGEDVRTVRDAWDACEDDAFRELTEREAKKAERERRRPMTIPPHIIRARAQDLAVERYPSLFETAG